jgi:hypothetical protein
MKRATLPAEAMMMKRVTLGRRIEAIIYDQAARKIEKTSGSSAIWQLQAELKKIGVRLDGGTMKGRSNYTDTVPLVRHLLNERRVIVHAGAEILRSQMKSCRFTELGGELREDNIKKGNDHCSDGARYLASIGPCWKKRPRNMARMRDDGGEIQFETDKQTPSDEDLNIREQMRVSKLYAEGRLPGWT